MKPGHFNQAIALDFPPQEQHNQTIKQPCQSNHQTTLPVKLLNSPSN
jgi:hypothetical protein